MCWARRETLWPLYADVVVPADGIARPKGGKEGFKPLADYAHSLGLKFGIWTLRGVHPFAVERKLPVLNADPPTTVDAIAYAAGCAADPSTHQWCNCTWDKEGVGLDATKPASATYYNGLVELYAEWGVDLIKWDCKGTHPHPHIHPCV